MRPALRIAIAAAVAVVLKAGPGALATERPLSAAEFEARVTGRTVEYHAAGQPFGTEQYLPGRKVVWAFTGDDCRDGEWYAEGPYICFVYEDDPGPQCWVFTDGPQGLTARHRDDPGGFPLIAVETSPEPMACMGPNVGV